MLTIAITGSNGEVGRRTVLEALKDGHSVIALDQGDEAVLEDDVDDNLRKRFTYKKADLKNRDAFLEAARGSDAMIHLAAVFRKDSAPESMQLPEYVSCGCAAVGRGVWPPLRSCDIAMLSTDFCRTFTIGTPSCHGMRSMWRLSSGTSAYLSPLVSTPSA